MKISGNSDTDSKVKDLKQKLKAEQTKNSITTAILEGGTLIIWAVDEKHNLISFNQNYFNYFMGHDSNSRITVIEKDETKEFKEKVFWKKKYDQALKGQSINFELKLNVNAKYSWKQVFLNPIYESSGEISGVSGLAYDITDKLTSKLALVESERMFRNIFESFQDLYFRCNFAGEILMLSPSVKDITGYQEEELLGKDITNYYLFKAKTKSLLRKLAIQTRVRNFEVELVDKKGSIIPCICNVRLIYNDKNKPIFIEGVARDITELKKTNKELLEAKEIAEESLKIKEKFLANMSHEIRTPLNGIVGMIHLLDSPDLKPKQKKYILSLKSSADILLNLLNDLLDLSKIEAGKMSLRKQPIITEELFTKLKSLYIEQAKSNRIDLNFKIDKALPDYLFTDETKLLQIFSNLISNALKFTPEQGQIDVSLNLLSKNKIGEIRVQGEVKDTGIGIEKEDQPLLFKSFTQLDSSSKKAFKGTGLGLYITQELIKLFNGTIKVKSRPGKGSTFTFEFDATATRIRPETKKATQKQLTSNPLILVVDDNDVNLHLAASILENAGCEVNLCRSGAKSKEMAAQKNYDIILMDIQMPDVDGIMASKNIRKKLKDKTPPIIAMTAYSMAGDKKKFLKAGFDDYIAKPIKPQLLIEKIEKWLESNLKYKKPSNNTNQSEGLALNSIDSNVLEKLESFGGKEVVHEALQEFNAECITQIKSAYKYFKEGNIKEVLTILHTLKGNAGTLGVKKMAELAENIESELKKEKYSIFEMDMSRMEKLHSSFEADLKTLMKNN